MIRRKNEQTVVEMENPKGGTGLMIGRQILNADELEKLGIGPTFNHGFLMPGGSLGYHQHVGNSETIYMLSGKAEYVDDQGDTYILEPGDMAFCDDGEYHSMKCLGDEPAEIISMILKK